MDGLTRLAVLLQRDTFIEIEDRIADLGCRFTHLLCTFQRRIQSESALVLAHGIVIFLGGKKRLSPVKVNARRPLTHLEQTDAEFCYLRVCCGGLSVFDDSFVKLPLLLELLRSVEGGSTGCTAGYRSEEQKKKEDFLRISHQVGLLAL